MQREQSKSDYERTGSEVLKGYKCLEPVDQFKDISFNNFNISVDELFIDFEQWAFANEGFIRS